LASGFGLGRAFTRAQCRGPGALLFYSHIIVILVRNIIVIATFKVLISHPNIFFQLIVMFLINKIL
jgi:hypothetical protein